MDLTENPKSINIFLIPILDLFNVNADHLLLITYLYFLLLFLYITLNHFLKLLFICASLQSLTTLLDRLEWFLSRSTIIVCCPMELLSLHFHLDQAVRDFFD